MKPFLSLLTTASLLLAEGYTIDATGNGGCPKGMDLIISVP